MLAKFISLKKTLCSPKNHKHFYFLCIIPISIVVISRIPFFIAENNYLDGDECLMGIMVFNVLKGDPIPFIVYGAQFGITFFEVATLSLVSWFFGLSDLTLRIPMIVLWACALLCTLLTVKRMSTNTAALVSGILFSACPAWFILSTKALHYNHTALLASQIAIYLIIIILSKPNSNFHLVILLSIFSALTFLTQPIYAIGVFPFIIHFLVKRKKTQDIFILLVGFLLFFIPYMFFHGLHEHYWNPPILSNFNVIASLKLVPSRYWTCLTGMYFLNEVFPAGILLNVCVFMWSLLLLMSIVLAIRRAFKKRFFSYSVLCIFSVILIFMFNLFINPDFYGYRYLVPTISFQSMLIGLEIGFLWDSLRFRKSFAVYLICFTLISIVAAYTTFSRTSFSGSMSQTGSESKDLQRLVTYLNLHNTRHVYCFDPLLQWKIMFSSHGKIVVRWFSERDRYQAYPMAVDKAFYKGLPVSFVGETLQIESIKKNLAELGFLKDIPELVGNRYFVIRNPSKKLILRYFKLNTFSKES